MLRSSRELKTIIKCSVTCLVATLASPLRASPRPLPYTYPYETLDQDELELEVYGDVTPLRVDVDPNDPSKGRLWEPGYTLQNEFEYGLTDRVELGFYQVFEAQPIAGGGNAMTFDGFKWEVRTRLGESGRWPVDVGLYLELETLHDEVALEEKIILARRFGPWHWMANVWVEEEQDRPLDPAARSLHFVINPTTGITYQVTPVFQPGIEYWARGEPGNLAGTPVDVFNREVHHFVGPTVHLELGKVWWSLGVYADVNAMGTPQPGEIYGPIWARTVLGLNL